MSGLSGELLYIALECSSRQILSLALSITLTLILILSFMQAQTLTLNSETSDLGKNVYI